MKYLLQITFLLQISISFASNIGTPFLTNFTNKQYGASTQNWSIGQDSNQVMYFANNDGLLSYDGSRWQVHHLGNKTLCRALLVHDGRIYVGGQGEIGYFEPNEKGVLNYHDLNYLIPKEHLNFSDIWHINVVDNSIYFQANNKLLVLVNNTISAIKTKGRIEYSEVLGNKLWVQDTAIGLCKVEGLQLIPVATEELMRNSIVSGLMQNGPNEIVVSTYKNGLYKLNKGKLTPWLIEATDFLKSNTVYACRGTKDKSLILATSQGGVVMVNSKGETTLHIEKSQGLQNNSILSVFSDCNNNLWLGLDNGIALVNVEAPFSFFYPDNFFEGTSYGGLVDDKTIYFSTNNGLFYKPWQQSYDLLYRTPFTKVKDSRGQCWGVQKVGSSIVVSHNDGALLVENGAVKPISNGKGSWLFKELKLWPNHWIEGTYTGLNLYEIRNGKPVFIKALAGFDESARFIEEDVDGSVWIAHPYRGVYRIQLDTLTETISSVEKFDKKDGFPSDLYIQLFKVFDHFYFTAESGVYSFDLKQKRFVPDSAFSQFFPPGVRIFRLKEDALHNVWFVTDTEIGVLMAESNGLNRTLKKYTFNQIRNSLVNGFELIFPVDESNVFIGSQKGMIHLNPQLLGVKPLQYNTLIRNIVVGSGEFGQTLGEGVVAASVGSNRIKIPWSANSISFSYSATNYAAGDAVKFSYQLIGFEKSQSEFNSRNEKEYTNLSPGKYQFVVKAINGSGDESKVAAFEFEILPPWYRTKLAYGLYSVLVILLLTLMILIPRKRFEAEKRLLKTEQQRKLLQKDREHTNLMEETEREMMRIKTEKLEAEIAHKNKELASTTMHLVQKTEMLNKLKLEMGKMATSKGAQPEVKNQVYQLTKMINEDLRLDKNWDQFENYFDQVHVDFIKHLRDNFPDLSPKEIKLCAYLRMNLATKEIAPLLNISVRGVEISRYRLRKKLNIDRDTNLFDFLNGL